MSTQALTMASLRFLPIPAKSVSSASAFGGLIEWEELPSLADSLQRRLLALGARRGADFEPAASFNGAWDATLPAALDPLIASGPFQESLQGLVTRELREPDVFRHFFA
jgi:hypothetical protein